MSRDVAGVLASADSLREFLEVAETEEIDQEAQIEALIEQQWGREIPRSRVLSLIDEERKNLESFDAVSLEESSRAPRYMDLNDLELLSGYEFEHVLAEILQRVEGEARVTELSGDQGVDVVWTRANETVGIQAKAYTKANPVGNSAVQEIHTGSKVREAEWSIDTPAVVTTSRYTDGAIEAAQTSGVQLFDRSDLRDWLETAELDSETMGEILASL